MSERSQAGGIVLQATGLGRRFSEGGLDVQVLHDIDLQVQAGETLAVVGASGSGKSTLLHLLGGLDAPTQGRVTLMGQDLNAMGAAQQGLFRNEHLGFVYQFHHLLPEFSALDNVAMPLRIAGKSRAAARERARALLEQLGLGERLHHQPAQMSGGEQQRVAIARALANSPKVVLADEPTGNLDPATSEAVFKALYELCRREGVAALVATHNMELARFMDRVYGLREGHLEARELG
jgi:lipoprotein-releasing system ATP-binding protein